MSNDEKTQKLIDKAVTKAIKETRAQALDEIKTELTSVKHRSLDKGTKAAVSRSLKAVQAIIKGT